MFRSSLLYGPSPNVLEQGPTVTQDNSCRYKPPDIAQEEHREAHLDEDKSDHQERHPSERPRHNYPATVQFSLLLAQFVSIMSRPLVDTKRKTNDSSGNQSTQR